MQTPYPFPQTRQRPTLTLDQARQLLRHVRPFPTDIRLHCQQIIADKAPLQRDRARATRIIAMLKGGAK